MKIHSHTFYYLPNLDDNLYYPAAVMASDIETGDTLFAVLKTCNPVAPPEHTPAVVDACHALFAEYTTNFEQGIPFHEVVPGDHFVVYCNPDVEADDLETGTNTLMDIHVVEPLELIAPVYATFTVDYRIGEKHYPLGIFAYDAIGGRFTGSTFGTPNPFLPALPRKQRRVVEREMLKFARALDSGDVQGALDRLDRPRFGVFHLDDFKVSSAESALQMGMMDLTALYFGDELAS